MIEVKSTRTQHDSISRVFLVPVDVVQLHDGVFYTGCHEFGRSCVTSTHMH